MSAASVQILMEKGFELLDAEDFKGAIEVGEQLRGMRHSSAFEILALAHAALGNTERAVETLEDGTQKAPTVWILWQLLGNCRSELGRFAKAHEAYKQALKCPGVVQSSVHLNTAIALANERRYDEALATLDLIDDDELLPRSESLRLGICNSQGRYEEVIERGGRLLARLTAEGDDEVRSTVQARLGKAYWKGRNDKEEALKLAWEALGHSHAMDEALWLIRDVEGQLSHKAKYYRLLVEGDWHELDEDGNKQGFFRSFGVVADDIAEAMRFVRRFELDEVIHSLRISEQKALESRPRDPKGVYTYTGHALFPKECEDACQAAGEDT